jgi:hypothetical protein
MKAYWKVRVHLHALLSSALDGGEWSASHSARFTPRERAAGTHWIGGLVGPRAVLDAVVKRKIPEVLIHVIKEVGLKANTCLTTRIQDKITIL